MKPFENVAWLRIPTSSRRQQKTVKAGIEGFVRIPPKSNKTYFKIYGIRNPLFAIPIYFNSYSKFFLSTREILIRFFGGKSCDSISFSLFYTKMIAIRNTFNDVHFGILRTGSGVSWSVEATVIRWRSIETVMMTQKNKKTVSSTMHFNCLTANHLHARNEA